MPLDGVNKKVGHALHRIIKECGIMNLKNQFVAQKWVCKKLLASEMSSAQFESILEGERMNGTIITGKQADKYILVVSSSLFAKEVENTEQKGELSVDQLLEKLVEYIKAHGVELKHGLGITITTAMNYLDITLDTLQEVVTCGAKRATVKVVGNKIHLIREEDKVKVKTKTKAIDKRKRPLKRDPRIKVIERRQIDVASVSTLNSTKTTSAVSVEGTNSSVFNPSKYLHASIQTTASNTFSVEPPPPPKPQIPRRLQPLVSSSKKSKQKENHEELDI